MIITIITIIITIIFTNIITLDDHLHDPPPPPHLKGTPLTPWAQMALLSLVSILTSLVPICFSANFLISFTALRRV